MSSKDILEIALIIAGYLFLTRYLFPRMGIQS